MTSHTLNRAMINVALMASTMMFTLDTTIINVALPQMQGQFGATPSEISWVLTSYIVASSIFMPLTGFFTDRLGQRRCLIFAISGFVITSVLCGLSVHLSQLVILRIAQGMSGAALAPLSQMIMTNIYEPEERGKAMGIWGLGVNFGPVIGPTLGGFLTEHLSWHWTFFINIPVGIMAVLLALRYVPDSPRRQERRMDWTGFILLGLAVGALQFVLDRGSRVDWFESHEIVLATMLCIIAFGLFLRHIMSDTEHPIFDPHIFLDRNFTVTTLTAMAVVLGLYGSMILLPIFLESLLNYPASAAGLLMSPRSVTVGFGMLLAGSLMSRVDARVLIATGMCFCTVSAVAMSRFTLNVDSWALVWPGLMQGMGVSLVMVPLSVLAYTSLPRERLAEATSVNNLMRSLGSSAGVSIAATLFSRYTQQGWQQLGGYANPLSPAVQQYLAGLHLAPDQPLGAMILAHEIAMQAAITAISKVYLWIAVVLILMLPLVFWLRVSRQRVEVPPVVAD